MEQEDGQLAQKEEQLVQKKHTSISEELRRDFVVLGGCFEVAIVAAEVVVTETAHAPSLLNTSLLRPSFFSAYTRAGGETVQTRQLLMG